MNRLQLRNTFLPLLAIFLLVNIGCIAYADQLAAHKVDTAVVKSANALLFVIAVICGMMHYRALKSDNPHAFVRSVMGATVLKLFSIAGAVLIYVYITGPRRNVPAILIGMGLYIVYTIVEVTGAFRLNKEKHGSH
jgi:hypothetical protein